MIGAALERARGCLLDLGPERTPEHARVEDEVVALQVLQRMFAGRVSSRRALAALRVAQALLQPHSPVLAVLRAAVTWEAWHNGLPVPPGLPNRPQAELLAAVRQLHELEPGLLEGLGEVQP